MRKPTICAVGGARFPVSPNVADDDGAHPSFMTFACGQAVNHRIHIFMIRRAVAYDAYPALRALPKSVERVDWATQTYRRDYNDADYDLATGQETQPNLYRHELENATHFVDSDDCSTSSDPYDHGFEAPVWIFSDNKRAVRLTHSKHGTTRVTRFNGTVESFDAEIRWSQKLRVENLMGVCGDTVFIHVSRKHGMINSVWELRSGQTTESYSMLVCHTDTLVSVSDRVTVVVPYFSHQPMAEIVDLRVRFAWIHLVLMASLES
jgi:hypothetical protein